KAKWLGEDQGVPQIMGLLDKEGGRQGRLRIALNAGIRIRGKTSTFDNNDPTQGMSPAPMAPVPVTGQTISVGSEIPVGLGIADAIAVQKFDIVAELFGSQPLGDHTNYQPLEAIGAVKLYLARNSFLSLGGGRGLLDGKGGNPDLRAFIGIVFEPNI